VFDEVFQNLVYLLQAKLHLLSVKDELPNLGLLSCGLYVSILLRDNEKLLHRFWLNKYGGNV